MNWWQIILTIFILGGILYNFQQSAEERGFDLIGGLFRMIGMILLIIAYPVLVLIKRSKKRSN